MRESTGESNFQPRNLALAWVYPVAEGYITPFFKYLSRFSNKMALITQTDDWWLEEWSLLEARLAFLNISREEGWIAFIKGRTRRRRQVYCFSFILDTIWNRFSKARCFISLWYDKIDSACDWVIDKLFLPSHPRAYFSFLLSFFSFCLVELPIYFHWVKTLNRPYLGLRPFEKYQASEYLPFPSM